VTDVVVVGILAVAFIALAGMVWLCQAVRQ
jgi:hypothetical protein